MELNLFSSCIIDAALNVHRVLGPGLLESVYLFCMRMELKQKGLTALSEVPLPVYYREQKIDDQGFRIDLLVEDRIIVELKSVEKVQAVHKKQLLTYLRLADKELGLLINFAGGTAEGRYSPDHQRPSERMNDLSHAEKGYISV